MHTGKLLTRANESKVEEGARHALAIRLTLPRPLIRRGVASGVSLYTGKRKKFIKVGSGNLQLNAFLWEGARTRARGRTRSSVRSGCCPRGRRQTADGRGGFNRLKSGISYSGDRSQGNISAFRAAESFRIERKRCRPDGRSRAGRKRSRARSSESLISVYSTWHANVESTASRDQSTPNFQFSVDLSVSKNNTVEP